MNFERLAGCEPRRCFGDMVSSILIAALRFMGCRFIVFPFAHACCSWRSATRCPAHLTMGPASGSRTHAEGLQMKRNLDTTQDVEASPPDRSAFRTLQRACASAHTTSQ